MMRLFLKTLLILGFSLTTSHIAEAQFASWSAPDSFYWREKRSEDSIRLELWSESLGPSEIVFFVDPLSKKIFPESVRRDSQLRLFIPGPHLEAYAAHPEKEKSLEEEFLDFLLRFKLLTQTNADTSHLDFEMPKYLEHLEFESEVESIDLIAQQLRDQILATENWALENLGLSRNLPGRQWLSNFNPIEAIRSIESGQKTRLDAYTLSPVMALQTDGLRMLQALEDLASKPDWYLLEWYMRSFQFSESVRLAVLMLVTHNHVAEDWFLLACASSFGIEEAWRAFQSINRIYSNERLYWTRHGLGRDTDETPLPSHVQNIYGIQEVNVSVVQRVLAKHYGVSRLGKTKDSDWLPYVQLYHYYGGFILSALLKNKNQLGDTSLKTLVRSFGLTYKLKTAGFDQDQIEKMLRFYGQAADDYLVLEDFIR